jgi:quinol monooxygenase YgiN
MSMIAVLGQVDIAPEHVEMAAELMKTLTAETIKESGCQHYAYSRDLLRSNRFQLSELWQDDASLAAHLQSDHVATYRQGISKLTIQARTVRRYEVSSGRDL